MSHLCILFVYKNYDHIKQCFESLYIDGIDFWVVENHSENSNQIQEYFISTKKLKKYFYFTENITNNAMKKVLEDFWQEVTKFDFMTISDCDLVVKNSKEAFDEVKKNASFDEVAFSCIDISLENFPVNVPGSHKWLPAPKAQTQEYIECQTGAHLMTVRREMMPILLEPKHLLDGSLFACTYARNKKWVKTINNKAYHLTWDLYVPGNSYYSEKVSTDSPTNALWRHDKMCQYVQLELNAND